MKSLDRSLIRRLAEYVWASPNSVLGLAGGLVMALLGARVRLVRGNAEFSGGLIGSLLASRAAACRFRAMTLGHVILATGEAAADACRDHEHVHVRQYERWGPFFLPAYLASSLWQLLCGRHLYRDNHFERQACDQTRAGSPGAGTMSSRAPASACGAGSRPENRDA